MFSLQGLGKNQPFFIYLKFCTVTIFYEQLICFLLNVSALFRGSCQYSLMLWLSLDQRTCPVQAVQQVLRLEKACSFYAIHMNIFLIWTFYVPSIGYAKLIFSASNSEVITPATVSWENTDSVNDIALLFLLLPTLKTHSEHFAMFIDADL